MYDPDEHMEEVDIDPVREIERLYIMIEDWIGGVRTDLSPLSDSLAEDFLVVTPDGVVRDREAYVEALEEAGEEYRDSDPPYVTDVQNATLQRTVEDRHLVTYELFERIEGDWQAQTHSVWLQEVGPAGVELLHLHQTWLDAPEEAAAAREAAADEDADDDPEADESDGDPEAFDSDGDPEADAADTEVAAGSEADTGAGRDDPAAGPVAGPPPSADPSEAPPSDAAEPAEDDPGGTTADGEAPPAAEADFGASDGNGEPADPSGSALVDPTDAVGTDAADAESTGTDDTESGSGSGTEDDTDSDSDPSANLPIDYDEE